MGQGVILELIASFVAGILLIGTISWLIGKKIFYIVIINSLAGGVILIILNIFKVLPLNNVNILMTAILGIPGIIINLFLIFKI